MQSTIIIIIIKMVHMGKGYEELYTEVNKKMRTVVK